MSRQDLQTRDWERVWVVFDHVHGELRFFAESSEEELLSVEDTHCVCCVRRPATAEQLASNQFAIVTAAAVLHFRAPSAAAMAIWLHVLGNPTLLFGPSVAARMDSL